MPISVQDLAQDMMGRKLTLEAMKDLKTVFDVVSNDSHTTERRLQIDVFAFLQSYDTGEIALIVCIPGNQNTVDSLTNPVLTQTSPH